MKKRKELREAIAKSADRVESNIYLEMILEVSEIFRKALCEECTELTELQWEQRNAIQYILSMENVETLKGIGTFAIYYKQGGAGR